MNGQLVGGTLIGLGGWSFLEEYNQTLLKVQNILDIILHISLALMVVGGVIFGMSFAGCLGALRENLCLLKLVFNLILINKKEILIIILIDLLF